jgi:hypothetical protein
VWWSILELYVDCLVLPVQPQFNAHTFVHHLLSTDNIALAVFLDFKSAYDIVPMKVVREALA